MGEGQRWLLIGTNWEFHDEALYYMERELSQTAGPVSSGPSKYVLLERSSFSQNQIYFLSRKGKYNQLLLYWELDGESTLCAIFLTPMGTRPGPPTHFKL